MKASTSESGKCGLVCCRLKGAYCVLTEVNKQVFVFLQHSFRDLSFSLQKIFCIKRFYFDPTKFQSGILPYFECNSQRYSVMWIWVVHIKTCKTLELKQRKRTNGRRVEGKKPDVYISALGHTVTQN